jgi:hypothetical protein
MERSRIRTLEDAIHQSLTSRRTPRHINIHRHNPIAASRNTITVMVITASIRTAAHRNNPSRFRHLIIDLSERRSHLVRERTGHNHNIGLAGRGTEDYTESILVVSWGGEMHHFDGAAGESEGHGPEGALTSPVGYLVEGCSDLVSFFQLSLPYLIHSLQCYRNSCKSSNRW